MKKVTIKRSQWQRGGSDNTYELFEEKDTNLWGAKTSSGCCLGHVLHQAHGKSYKSMRGVYAPDSLAEKEDKNNPLTHKTKSLVFDRCDYNCTDFAEEAIRINDDNMISDKMREYRLKLLFKRNGYELEFVD
jgi:hypothetical protein